VSHQPLQIYVLIAPGYKRQILCVPGVVAVAMAPSVGSTGRRGARLSPRNVWRCGWQVSPGGKPRCRRSGHCESRPCGHRSGASLQ